MINLAQLMNRKWRHRIFAETWSLGFVSDSLTEIVSSGNLGQVTWLEPTRNPTFLADPFPWLENSSIVCEEAPLLGGKGRIISVARVGDRFVRAGTILETKFHHSYPCTFVHEGHTYMLPESFGGPTTLYRLSNQGNSTTAVCVISEDRRLADSTLFAYDGKFWLACTDLGVGIDNNLCLLYADNINGPWHDHKIIPVKTDVSSCRPAGSVFSIDGTLYRPAQDCSITYGGGIAINRIDLLTTDTFSETTVARLKPDANGPFPDGLHTLTSDGSKTWIDGKRFVFHLPTLLWRIKQKLFNFC